VWESRHGRANCAWQLRSTVARQVQTPGSATSR